MSAPAEIVHDFTAEDATTYAAMVVAMGAAITAARNVGKPDPTDDQIYWRLTELGFHPVDIRRWFAMAKKEATDA